MSEIVERVESLLSQYDKAKSMHNVGRFHKNGTPKMGYYMPVLREVATKVWQDIKNEPKETIYSLAEELMEAGEITIPFDWVYRLRHDFVTKDIMLFEEWISRFVHDWGACDDLCTRSIGYMIERFPSAFKYPIRWAHCENMWFRRASAVSLIYPLRLGSHLETALEIAETLLTDTEDLVQKGYGWMLKVATKHHRDKVFKFIIENKAEMPRTALRYAIEKLPPEMKKEAMS